MTVSETFQRGGHETAYGSPGPGDIGEHVVYPEWVTSRTVTTPDGDGLVVRMTVETWSADGTPPVVRSLFDDSVVTGLPDPNPSVPVEEPWDLIGWMDTQLDAPAHAEEREGTPTLVSPHCTVARVSAMSIVHGYLPG
ncbi:MAG: hypothetical protein F4X98_17130 [Gammaproteobacteria bacterium]|nr:hypothetical protein [Gammaproteobacteria bacterium]